MEHTKVQEKKAIQPEDKKALLKTFVAGMLTIGLLTLLVLFSYFKSHH